MDREQCQFEPVRNSDLVVNVAQIILDDLLRRAQLRSDFFVLVSLDDERDDAELFRCQAVADAQSDHIVFGEFAWDSDILHPSFAPRDFAHAIYQRSAGDVSVDNTVSAI